MSNVLHIRANFPEVARRLEALPEAIGNKALVRSMNTVVEKGKVQMARQINQEFRIAVGVAKDRLSVTKASARGGVLRFQASLEATRRGKGRSMNLIAFVTTKARQTKKGMTQVGFQIKRGGGRKMIPGAFVGNQGRTMFIRTGKARLPIKALNTIDVPQMFNTRRINQIVRQAMLDGFDAAFKRELRAVLKGFVK